MHIDERKKRLAQMLKQTAPKEGLEAIELMQPMGLESARATARDADLNIERAAKGIRALAEGRLLADDEVFGLEAIVMPRNRPVIDIVNDDFNRPPAPWQHLGSGDSKTNILRSIKSVGRIELPGHPRFPYGGTGFVVGDGLLMTNRHVAEIFSTGLGRRSLLFRAGHKAGVDFVQEAVPRDSEMLHVIDILMIHPHWDMALLKVSGLDSSRPPLRLSVTPPENFLDHDIAVIGYPAQDPRNDIALQNQIFRGIFDVKRLQPGKLKRRELITDHFGNSVNTATHDASTLGGNSGSAVINVANGEVIGLHFGGQYLLANYAVPSFELARDRRVVDAGVNFVGAVEPTAEWDEKWRLADSGESVTTLSGATPAPIQTPAPSGTQSGQATWTIPLQVSITLGSPTMGNATSMSTQNQIASTSQPATSTAGSSAGLAEIPLKIPVIYDDLDSRTGYDPDFLKLSGGKKIAIPKLTAAGKQIAAKLEDGSTELRYHKFSVVMNKKRRMALFTASNVDWRPDLREVDGRKPSRKELTGIPDGFAEQWVTDPRIPDAHQLPDVFYTKDRASFDKGHLVRRDDVCWGDSFEDIQMANGDTYHTTNCSPQVKGFNQSQHGEDNWGDLETRVEKQTKAEKAIVLAGPVFNDEEDPEFKGKDSHGTVMIKIPQKYWKIIVTKGPAGPRAFGFVLEQDLGGVSWEMAVPIEWKQYMRPISEIEELLDGKATFGDLADYDQRDTTEGRKIESVLKRK